MEKKIVAAPGTGIAVYSADDRRKLDEILRAGTPANTQRAYASDWARWTSWCARKGATPLPCDPRVLASFLTEMAAGVGGMAPMRPSTIARNLAAITRAHALKGLPAPSGHPQVREIMKQIKRAKGSRPERKAAIDLPLLRRLLATMPEDALRNRALLLLGFSGGFRRSEFTAVTLEHLRRHSRGLLVFLPRSKTDQTGEGAWVPLEQNDSNPSLCPVRTLAAWITAAGIRGKGYVFPGTKPGTHITAQTVTRVIKEAARAAGIDPESLSAHSLRSGFITQALRDGATPDQVRRVSRHRSLDTLLDYQRESDPMLASAALGFWDRAQKEDK